MAVNEYGVDMNGNPNTTTETPINCGAGSVYEPTLGKCITGTMAPTEKPTTQVSNTTTPTQPNRFDQNYILDSVKKFSQLPGVNPSTGNDPNYWLGRIMQTGGLGPDNMQYWQNLAMRPEGAPEGGGVNGFLAGQGGVTTPPPATYKPTAYTGSPTSFAGYDGPPVTQYQFKDIPKYQAPSSQALSGDVVNFLLGNTSLSPEVVAKMKEQQKDSVTAMSDQLNQNMLQSAAGRGVLGGGSFAANKNANDMNMVRSLSEAYRNIDIQKALQDTTDKQNAVNLSNQYGSQLLNQFLGEGNLNLNADVAKAGEAGRFQDQSFKEYSTQEDMREKQAQAEFQNYMAEQGLNLAANQADLQRWLASQGLNLDWSKWNTMGPLSVADFLAK